MESTEGIRARMELTAVALASDEAVGASRREDVWVRLDAVVPAACSLGRAILLRAPIEVTRCPIVLLFVLPTEGTRRDGPVFPCDRFGGRELLLVPKLAPLPFTLVEGMRVDAFGGCERGAGTGAGFVNVDLDNGFPRPQTEDTMVFAAVEMKPNRPGFA